MKRLLPAVWSRGQAEEGAGALAPRKAWRRRIGRSRQPARIKQVGRRVKGSGQQRWARGSAPPQEKECPPGGELRFLAEKGVAEAPGQLVLLKDRPGREFRLQDSWVLPARWWLSGGALCCPLTLCSAPQEKECPPGGELRFLAEKGVAEAPGQLVLLKDRPGRDFVLLRDAPQSFPLLLQHVKEEPATPPSPAHLEEPAPTLLRAAPPLVKQEKVEPGWDLAPVPAGVPLRMEGRGLAREVVVLDPADKDEEEEERTPVVSGGQGAATLIKKYSDDADAPRLEASGIAVVCGVRKGGFRLQLDPPGSAGA
nr:uncharacterized protein LOC101953007 [Chrysemys picta bellii]